MSLPLTQSNSGLEPSDELKALMSLPEVLESTSYISTSGRVYRLFGNEEKAYAMPEIPAIPPVLATPKSSALSLDDALQQIEAFATPATSGTVTESRKTAERPAPNVTVRTADGICTTPNPPTLQLSQALGEPIVPNRHIDSGGVPLKLVSKEHTSPNVPPTAPLTVTFSVKDVAREGSPFLPVITPSPLPPPKEERRQPLRVISDHVEEPFIVPFAKPAPFPIEPETKNIELKLVTEAILSPPIRNNQHFVKILRQHRRKEETLYRKQFTLPPVSVAPPEELPEVNAPILPVDVSTFQWSAQLDSLMQTANSQIRTLTDHLIVQCNQGMKAMCFKSVFPGDGCSTILLCAVRALMERNYRILLIDAHHRHLDLPKQLNLSGNLETGNDLITVKDRLGFWVWQESKTTEENRALLAKIVTAHRERYDFILLDDGSVTENPLTDFVAFWNQVELNGVVLISNTKRPTEMPLSHIAGRLREHHIPLIGIAENYV